MLAVFSSYIHHRTLRHQNQIQAFVMEELFFHKKAFPKYNGRLLLSLFRNSTKLILWELALQRRPSAQRLHSKAYDQHQLCVVIILIARYINPSRCFDLRPSANLIQTSCFPKQDQEVACGRRLFSKRKKDAVHVFSCLALSKTDVGRLQGWRSRPKPTTP